MLFRIFQAAFLICTLFVSCYAQWKPTSGPGAVEVSTLRSVGSTLYATTRGNGIFRSRDKGVTWVAINNGLTTFDFNDLYARSGLLLAASEKGGVFRSIDDGGTWSPSNGGLTSASIKSFAVRTGEIYLSLFANGVFRSTDDGRNWQLVSALDELSKFSQIYIVAAGEKIIATDGFRYRKLPPNSSQWERLAQLDFNPAVSNILGIAAAGSNVYIIHIAGMHRSVDGGEFWEWVIPSKFGFTYSSTPQAVACFDNVVLVGAGEGIFLSTNQGRNWRRFNAGLKMTLQNSFARIDTTYFAAGKDGIVYASEGLWETATITNAASYNKHYGAPDSIASIFGINFSNRTESARTVPLPASLADISVTLKDSRQSEYACGLFFVSPQQINVLLPSGAASGAGYLTVRNGANVVAYGDLNIDVRNLGGVFTFNATGQGVPAGVVLRIKASREQTYEPLAGYEPVQGLFLPVPIKVSNTTDRVFLVLFGTGFRNFASLGSVTAKAMIPGASDLQLSNTYLGIAPGLVGVDQLNFEVPNTRSSFPSVDAIIQIMINGQAVNYVTVRFY